MEKRRDGISVNTMFQRENYKKSLQKLMAIYNGLELASHCYLPLFKVIFRKKKMSEKRKKRERVVNVKKDKLQKLQVNIPQKNIYIYNS